MNANTYDIKIKDSVTNPNVYLTGKDSRTAYYKQIPGSDTQMLYKVWLYLDGRDLPFVKSVKYILHNSFKNPVKIVERTSLNQNCAFAIWTWGIFLVKAELEDVKGRIVKIEHYLTYGNQIKNKDDLRIAFKDAAEKI